MFCEDPGSEIAPAFHSYLLYQPNQHKHNALLYLQSSHFQSTTPETSSPHPIVRIEHLKIMPITSNNSFSDTPVIINSSSSKQNMARKMANDPLDGAVEVIEVRRKALRFNLTRL